MITILKPQRRDFFCKIIFYLQVEISSESEPIKVTLRYSLVTSVCSINISQVKLMYFLRIFQKFKAKLITYDSNGNIEFESEIRSIKVI